jgi:hypothetical protein
MGKPSKEVLDFMAKYSVATDEVWEVHGSTWVVKHKALERVAAEQGIVWDRPAILECNSADGVAALCVFGKLGERMEWSIGEALVAKEGRIGGNYKVTGRQAGYVYAMAEKRAKDRVILKLLSAAVGLYSEAEADEFEQPRQNPHVTRPEDIAPKTQFDTNGQPIDNIPHAKPDVKPMSKAKSRVEYDAIQKEIWATGSEAQLTEWGASNADRVGALPADWKELIRGTYREHMDALRAQDNQDQQRMAS